MTATPVMTDEQAAQTLEALKRRWGALRDRKIRAEADVARLEKELAAAEADAVEKFGTASLDDLRAIVVEARTANAQALADFEAAIAESEARLADINANV